MLLNMRDPGSGECPIAVAARREDLASIGADGPNICEGHGIDHAWTIDVAPTLAAISEIDKPAQSEGKVLDDIFE